MNLDLSPPLITLPSKLRQAAKIILYKKKKVFWQKILAYLIRLEYYNKRVTRGGSNLFLRTCPRLLASWHQLPAANWIKQVSTEDSLKVALLEGK